MSKELLLEVPNPIAVDPGMFEHSCPLADIADSGAAAAGIAAGERRALRCAAVSSQIDIPTCIGAWHAVLHLLRHGDDPVVTCIRGADEAAALPILTHASGTTTLADLIRDVRRQWRETPDQWLRTADHAESGLLDQLRCHAVVLDAANRGPQQLPEFALIQDADGWRIDCAAERFGEAYQRTIATLWHAAVAAAVEAPDTLVVDAFARDADENSGPSMPVAGTLVSRFSDVAASRPDGVAVVDTAGSITFAELDALSSRWSAALLATGVGRGECVGVSFGRNRGMIAAQLAVLKAGAAFVPLDAAQPGVRLSSMADDADMRFVLAERDIAAALEAAIPSATVLVVEDIAEPASHDATRAAGASSDDLAYVIFTSGSTGRPKGVKVSHRNLLNFVVQIGEWFAAGEAMSQFAPFTFDAAVAEIHASILNGGTIVLLSPELIDDPERLQQYLTAQRVAFMAVPPQYAKHLSPDKLPTLKTLLTAGSAPDHELIRRWHERVRYINAYGPTETTVLSTAWIADRAPEVGEPIKIGRPMNNTAVKIVNRFGRALPAGCVGELLIGGAGVAQGYLKRPELDDEKFVDADGDRWYRSGDLACIAEDGELIFAGRVDDQIKLRGHRLEPGEVEIALASLPGMHHAAVVAVDIDAGKQLIAFCVGERQADADVRTGLAGKLPAWALPNRLVWLEAMPITVNGKVDYRLLRQRALDNSAAAASDVVSAGADALDAVESEVAQVWRNVLQQPVLSRDDHFVHLGGDSLTALVVMSALKRIGYQATSSQLLAHPRLADFADLLRHSDTRLQRQYERVEGSAPLGPIQGWFFDLSLRNPSTFCQTLVVEVDEALDAARLENALRALIDHHDGLRARFISHPQYGWRQDIAADDPVVPAVVVEAVDQADDAWLSTATDRMREALAADIDISQAPLFRVGLLRSGGRSRVVWVLHHLIVDTISHALLLEDLHQLYVRSAEAPSDVLPGKSTSYLDWSAAIHREVTTHAASHLQAWRPLLAGVASADRLPLGDAATAGKISIVDCALDRADTSALIERATACYRQSTEDLVLAATYLAFQRSFGLRSLAIDVEWHGRDEATGGDYGIDRTVGWFTSVHPLPMDLPADLPSSDAALGDWLVALKDSRAAVPQRGRHFYAMRYLSDDADTRAAFAQYRSPQVLFNFSGVVQRSQAGWKTVPTVAIELGDGNASPYAVSVESEIRDGELTVSLYLDTDAWPAGVADRLRRDMGEALRRVIAHCVDPAHGRWTASDFPRVALDRAELDRLPRGVKDVYPLTDMQQTMYRHKDTYQVVMCYRMPMAFDAAAWTPAAADWVARHDCLRTFIRELPGGALCQIVLDALQAPMTVHRVAVGEAPAQVLALVDARRACAVVIDQAPLFDLQIVDDGGDAFDVVLSIHHIIHDGWSIDLLLNDLLQAYRHRSGLVARGPSAPLAGMADIVDQQQRLRDDPKWRAYWNDLPWAAASAQLPASLKARAGDDALTRRDVHLYQAPMDPILADEVRAGARRLGVTVNSLWLAGYVALLRYLGGQTQVRCGVIQNGRMEEIPGVETITGCCVNNLPLVIDVGAEDTAERIVASVATQLDRMRESAAFPLSLIHESVKTRIEGELFDVLFNIESHRYGADDGQPRPQLTGGYESTNYGFIFGLIERDADSAHDAASGRDGGAQTAYGFRIGYDADRYALSSVQDWVRIYGECLRALVADPQRPWRSIDPLPDDLRAQALNAWNDTTRRYPSERCVEALFREQAAAHPDRPALLYRDRVVGYAQLDALSDRLAAVLQQRGIGPEKIVALVADRSPDMVVAMLAIYKAGAAFVPIDPRYPVDRVRHMVADTATTLALVQNRTLDYVIPDDLAVERLYLDEYADVRTLDTASPVTLAPVVRDSRQLAYVMYTSGSTGNPKGVMIEQRSIVRLIANSEDIRFAQEDRILLTSAPGFDVTTFEVWSALLNGLALGIIDEETLLDPPALRREIVDKRITMLWLIAPLFNQLVQEMPDLFAGVKQLMIGGDALSPAHVQMVRDANPGLQVINGYGPTENTSFSTYHFVGDDDRDVIPIGRPITNSTAYVVNADGQLLPPGVNGELWVGGPGVARGYLNQPELTASKFVADRFGHGSGHDARDTLYRTGDLVRWRRDGLIDFLGRIDHQVKIRGFRIELGEIENTIAEHPAIKQTVVLVKQDGVHKQLVAYCVPKTFDPADDGRHAALATDVSDSMRNALPDYMVPSAFVFLPEFARNTNGKIDRGMLAAIDIAPFMLGSRVEPDTDAERTLWSIWCDVLGTGAFGVTDSFFAVGGDSIMAIQVTSRAAKAGLALSQRTIIEKRTIRDIAATLAPAAADQAPMQSDTATADAAATDAQPLRFTLNADGDGGELLIESDSGKLSPERARALKAQLAKALAMLESMPEEAPEALASSEPAPAAPSPATAAFDGIDASMLDRLRSAYPDLQDVRACTAMQDGMLLFSDSESADGQYVTQIRLTLAGLDAARMRRSWELLIARHEALRTVFAASADAGMLQLVLGDVVLPWEEIDLSAAADAEAALAHALEDARNRPFDPARAPLMRVLAARIDGDHHCMAWSYHHALIDGWSMALLLKELFDLYAGDLDASAAHAVVSSRDYLAWLRGRDRPQAAAYWQHYLCGLDIAASATLPLSTSSRVDEREGAQSLLQTSHKRSLDDAASARIASFARRQNVSLGTVMLAAWGMLLGKYNNEPEVLFGYTTSGRSVPVEGIESMTGLFINSLPIRLAIEADTAVGDWLRTIQARQLDHEDHCHVPLTEIQRHSGRSPGQKLYESMVVVENFPIDPSLMSMRTETGTRLLAVEAEGQNDVALVLTVFPGARIAIDMACRASLFDAAHATRLLDQFEQLLLSLSADDVRQLSDVSMLDAAQLRRALETWNDTAADYPRTLRFNEVFEDIAARHADATALVLDGDRWSYRRLAERARAIGAWLKRNGVRPNDKVALSLEREPELIASMLGAMYAEAAYVPIALNCPQERRAYMIGNAGIRHIVSRREHAANIEASGIAPLYLEDCPQRDDAPYAGRSTPDANAESAVYVIYTSGTTGTPKGVEVTHRNLVNYSSWFVSADYAQPGDRFTQFAPYTFDASVGEIYASLHVGGELHFLTDELIENPRDLERYFRDQEISFTILPPPYLHQMEPTAVPQDLVVMTIGSAPTIELVQRWAPHCRYVNAYGPTETTYMSSAWNCEGRRFDDAVLSVGRPIANTTMYIVDRLGQLCAPGLTGEVYIGGDGVSCGYFNQPELTAKSFIRDPWRPQERVYRTGDLGRWLDDGRIEFLGRRDRQVKVRGFRIELNEIEDRIRQHADVSEATVQVRGDDDQKRLLAWVVRNDRKAGAADGVPQFVAELRAFIAESLPHYMIPQAIVTLEQMPLSTNGKLDARALPEAGQQDWFRSEYVAPEGEIEQRLAEIWSELLKIQLDQLSVTADFFESGGDSIMAIQAASRAAKHDIPLSPRRIIEGKHIRGIAARIAEALAAAAKPAADQAADTAPAAAVGPAQTSPLSLSPEEVEALTARFAPVEAVYPCTGMQQGMLMLVDGQHQDGLYVTQLRIDVGAVEPARMHRSWERLIARHPILRTGFARAGDGRFAQVVHPEAALPWEEADLRGASGRRRDDELDALIAQARRAGFDLQRPPLMRVLLARLEDARYAMVWTHHHALMDGWSMASVAKELFGIYASLDASRDAGPDALDAPDDVRRPGFDRYLQWLDARDWAAADAYWTRYLAGLDLSASADLPMAFAPDDKTAAHRQGQDSVKIALDEDTGLALGRLCRTEKVGIGTAMLAAWGLLLSKYNTEQDVLFGYTSSGRPAEIDDVESLVGLFINSLPIRVGIVAEVSIGDWLRDIQRHQLDNEDQGFMPLSDIHRASGRRAGQALFESLVVVENFPIDHAMLSAGPGRGVEILDVQGLVQTDFPLNLVVIPGDRPTLELVYQNARFDRGTIQTMVARLEQILRGFAAGGGQRIADIAILTDAERTRAIHDWNNTRTDAPRDKRLPELYDVQMQARPDAIAVVSGDEAWSYRRLGERARAIAAALLRHGAAQGARIGLSLEKGPELVAAMLGIHYAGGAYVPIAVDCPPERRAFILADAGIAIVVSERRFAAEIAVAGVDTLLLEDVDNDTSASNAFDSDTAARIAALGALSEAYVIYTSGTTGMPKGVAISHRNLINFCLWCGRPGMIAPGMRTAQFAPYTFDASAGEIFSALVLGAELHLLSNALIQEPRALADYYRERDIQFSAFPPPYLQQLSPEQLPAGMTIVTAGSAPSVDLVKRWGAHFHYVNGYGPTETTILSTAWACEAGRYDGGRLPIGRPIDNTSVYVVDGVGQLCAPGLTGEIMIAGDGVALGYLNREDLNAAQFIDDPWRPGQRLYRTGDHGRWLDDGNIEFVGRRDRQIKLRGYRIELNEIEARLLQHPEVEAAAVSARGDHDDKRLLAWVVRRTGDDNGRDDAAFVQSLRDFMAQTLPAYMLPQAILVIDRMPLTANGKIDDKALPQPCADDWFAGEYIAPRNDTESRIAEIWAQVLQIEPAHVGATADFFESGGNSLLAMRVVARVREVMGMEVGVADLLANPVLGRFADAVQASHGHVKPPMARIDRSGTLPLSFAQQRLWFLAQMEGASNAYNIPGALRLTGALDKAALQRALDRIVARHETLRTQFDAVDGAPQLRIMPADVGFGLRHIDLRDLSGAEDCLAGLMNKEAGYPFDLRATPLIRGLLVQLGEREHALLVTMHHIVMDAWSIARMIQELGQLYSAFVAGGDDPLPELAVQYVDYAAWQRDWLRGDVWDAQSRYWQDVLSGAPAVLELPTDRLRPAQQDYAGDVLPFAFEPGLSAALHTLAQRNGTTLYMTMLAAWSVVLSRLSGQSDIVIGSPVTNRAQADIEPLIGFFVNTLAFRIDLSGTPTVAELLARVRDRVIAGQQHQDLPFERVVDLVQPPRSMAHTPIFQVMFNWQDDSRDALGMGDVKLAPIDASHALAKFDLNIDMYEDGGRIRGAIEYATALFDRDTVERHFGYLQRVLEAMVADPHRSIHRIELLGDAELKALDGFNDTYRPELIQRTWPELFDAQVSATPDRVAVECDRQRLTYAELDARSARIAHALVRRGAGPGTLVALLARRDTDLLATIVGVLRAGAAYVPLDPTHPQQRWLEILDDADPTLLWIGEGALDQRDWIEGRWQRERIVLDADFDAAPQTDDALAWPSLDDLAYVIFTSGSTGKPKGVMIEHRGMINNMLSKFEPLSLCDGDVIAQTASQCFDISVWQFLTALLLGAKVSIVSSETTRDPEALLRRLDATGVTVWEPVPSVMQAVLPLQAPLPKMRWVLPTGEALPRELVTRWFEQYPSIPLMNAYGPAECSDDVSFQPMHAPVDRVSIGSPVANAHLHVVDDHLMLLPMGAVGELAISGPVVGRGYLNRPAETEAVFRANPFARHDADRRLYLTSDLVRRARDGSLEFVGRKDFQVKIRGFRIELGEIESCFETHPSVLESVVLARDMAGEKRLVAYVTQSEPASAEAMLAHLRTTLPDYMIPSAIVVLERMPLTPNGKIDRKAMPEPSQGAMRVATFEAPQTDLERTVAAVWQELLDVPEVGRHDSFFDIGGNSILLMRMLSRLRDAAISLSIVDVYQLRTVQAIAEAAERQTADIDAWLADAAWPHQRLTVRHGDEDRSVLLLEDRPPQKIAALKQLIARSAAADRPWSIQTTDNVERLAAAVCSSGLKALGRPSRIDTAGVRDDIARRLQARRDRVATAVSDDSFPFSGIQKSLSTWQHRNALQEIVVQGWWSQAELADAFAWMTRDQDLLRALPDHAAARWQLVDGAAFVADDVSWVDLRGVDAGQADATMRDVGERLLAALGDSPLPYAATWLSLSDTDHRLLLAADHLIWDGVSSDVMARRLSAALTGARIASARRYRDYIADTEACGSDAAAQAVFDAVDPAALANATAATRRALETNADKPLQVIAVGVPRDADRAPAEQAFDLFKRAVVALTGLDTFGMVLNHHGRQLGSRTYFDQVGLFLDKIPYSVARDTTLDDVLSSAERFQKQGVHCVSADGSAATRHLRLLPAPADEVMFNFQPVDADDPMSGAPDAASIRARFDGFRGIILEAYGSADTLGILLIFRGDPRRADAVRALFDGAKRFDNAAGTQPHRDGRVDMNANTTTAAIEIHDVRKRYGDLEVVKGVSFRVEKGCCIGILGPNGAGKTSLLGMIEGIVPITSGRISVLGMDVATQIRQIQPRIGVQLQQNNYFQFLTVAELLDFYMELRTNNSGKRTLTSPEKLLTRLDLTDKLKFKVDELSGGQKQRLSIAIALLGDPEVIFLDEPTSALDPHSRRYTWEFIEELKEDRDRTIVLTTHYMEEAERLCDEILIMNQGEIVDSGNPATLVATLNAQQQVRFKFEKGVPGDALAGDLGAYGQATWDEFTDTLIVTTDDVATAVREGMSASTARGIPVLGLDIGRLSLEDVFLNKTGKGLKP